MSVSVMCAWGESGGFFMLKTESQFHIGLGKFAITFMKVDIYEILDTISEKGYAPKSKKTAVKK